MSEQCDHNCSSCAQSQDCTEKNNTPQDFLKPPHEMSSVKHIIGVLSGKGGVGKSMITSLLAVSLKRLGYRVGILDADITGPSIPKAFGIREKAAITEYGTLPVKTKTGIDIMSINLLLPKDTDPVVWRGPLIGQIVEQFWTDVIWDDIDYLLIDMPPGTGDVPLTVFQSIPIEGILVITSPQQLVSMIVQKAVKMAEMMHIPILGLIENMSYFTCPDNGKNYAVFGESHIEEIAAAHRLKVLAKLPIDPSLTAACDEGSIEFYVDNPLASVAKTLQQTKGEQNMKIAVASENQKIAEHFGHCRNFNIFQIENDKIVSSTSVDNPGHKPGFLPNFLHEQGVNVIIAGGMGAGAIEIFQEKGIEIIIGASGDATEAVNAYLEGTLKSTGSVCQDHKHHDECGSR